MVLNMKIGIIGTGFIGNKLISILQGYHSIFTYDITDNPADKFIINDCDISFICVPTPPSDDGSCDTSIVESIFTWFDGPTAIIRSTMPENWQPPIDIPIVYQPEFIGESEFHRWKSDRDVPFVVSGYLPGQEEAARLLLDLWRPILGPDKSYHLLPWNTASQIKYISNVFHTVKIAFFMEALGVCEDPDSVRNILTQIPWIESYGTLPLGKIGGKCLPKDIRHWIKAHDSAIGRATLKYLEE